MPTIGNTHLSPTQTAVAVATTVVGLAVFAWPVAIWYEVRKCEKPAYKVLKTFGSSIRAPWDRSPALEIRQYDPHLVAKVTVEEDNMKKALGIGFKKIASFIFGENFTAKDGKTQEKIAMTSPVVTQMPAEGKSEKIAMTSPVTTEMQDGKYVVSFIMPSKYTLDSLPRPKDSDVKVEEVPAQTFGALSWRGWPTPTESSVAGKRSNLLAALKKEGVHVDESASTTLYQYYPPFCPQFLRLQDVVLPVKYEGGKKGQ